jgi:hypothetical protein
VRPQEWLGSWREVDHDAALTELARRYLSAYGPATKQDFTRWWGSWSGVGNAAWSGLKDDVTPVSIEGQRADVLVADLDGITEINTESTVLLLPPFDPYLMGHSSRDHLFAPEFRSRVSRVAGWISAVVLVDGRVAATWTHQVVKGTLAVTVEPFRKLPPRVLKEVRARVAELADALSLSDEAVKVA